MSTPPEGDQGNEHGNGPSNGPGDTRVDHPVPDPPGHPSDHPADPPTEPSAGSHQDVWSPPPAGTGGAGGWGPSVPPSRPRDGLGIAALVLGVVAVLTTPGVVLGFVLGLLALIFGVIARGRVRRGEAVHRGVATAGVVLGAIAMVLAVVLGVLGAIFLPRLTSLVERPTASVQQCVANAHGDRSAIRQCRQQFGRHGRGTGRGT